MDIDALVQKLQMGRWSQFSIIDIEKANEAAMNAAKIKIENHFIKNFLYVISGLYKTRSSE